MAKKASADRRPAAPWHRLPVGHSRSSSRGQKWVSWVIHERRQVLYWPAAAEGDLILQTDVSQLLVGALPRCGPREVDGWWIAPGAILDGSRHTLTT